MEIAIYRSTDNPRLHALTRDTRPSGKWHLVGLYKKGEAQAGLPPREMVEDELSQPDVAYIMCSGMDKIKRVLSR